MFILPISSRASEVLNKIPCWNPKPFPTIIATGVASPNAHGQDITNTEIARSSAYTKLAPASNQPIITMTEITMTTGTNTPEILSAILAIGAFVAAASLTI